MKSVLSLITVTHLRSTNPVLKKEWLRRIFSTLLEAELGARML